MASLIYNSLLDDLVQNNVDFGADTFKALLVTATYSPNKDTHNRRDDVTNEVTGTGYTAGGVTVAATVAAIDTTNDRLDVTFADAVYTSVNGFTAAAAVLYKSRGGASSADELVAFVEFAAPVAANGSNYTVTFSSPLRLQN